MNAAAIEPANLQRALCESLCASVTIEREDDGTFAVHTPFEFDDGDEYQIYLVPLQTGGLVITDCAHTLMHMSYRMDVDALFEGTRGRCFVDILAEHGVELADGSLRMVTTTADLGADVVRFGQVVTGVRNLSFLNRARVESTFYEDLGAVLASIVPGDKIAVDYVCEGVPDADKYRVDYRIAARRQLFVFGIPNKEKARLATIILQYLHGHGQEFDSLLVFSDQKKIGGDDLARLSNAGGEQVASLDPGIIKRKVLARIAA